jgi:GTP-binding protein LepA
MEYVDATRVMLTYRIPLAELIVDFYDKAQEHDSRLRQPGLSLMGIRRAAGSKLDVLVQQADGRRWR